MFFTKGLRACLTVGERPYLWDEEQSQRGRDCTMGMEEEEEKGPVWVQGRNQRKPKGQMGQGGQCKWQQPACLTSLDVRASPVWCSARRTPFLPSRDQRCDLKVLIN